MEWGYSHELSSFSPIVSGNRGSKLPLPKPLHCQPVEFADQPVIQCWRQEQVNLWGMMPDDESDKNSESMEQQAIPFDAPAQKTLPVVTSGGRKYVAYTVKLPSEQLAALQSIWLELKRLYGPHSPDKSGMIQQAITDWLKKWDGPDRQKLLQDLLEIREDTRKRQYKKD